ERELTEVEIHIRIWIESRGARGCRNRVIHRDARIVRDLLERHLYGTGGASRDDIQLHHLRSGTEVDILTICVRARNKLWKVIRTALDVESAIRKKNRLSKYEHGHFG